MAWRCRGTACRALLAVRRHNHSSATHPPLGVNATHYQSARADYILTPVSTSTHPCGVNATRGRRRRTCGSKSSPFNKHPPLGVNATARLRGAPAAMAAAFQQAPTLGGECYAHAHGRTWFLSSSTFQRAPTLGGECYGARPPRLAPAPGEGTFQRAPTLGGECYDWRDRGD